MATFLLVHGAWHGGWCWSRLAPVLQSEGHRVLTPDLPGLGDDRTPLDTLGFNDWIDSVLLHARGAGAPVVLVGHSRGGVVISRVAERTPELIDRLIYLTAFLVADGQSLMATASAADPASKLSDAVVFDPSGVSVTVKDEAVQPIFYNLCSEADVAFARARLRPEPLFGLTTPIHTTNDRFGRTPRYYIECAQDRAIDIAVQRRMQVALPCRATVTLDCDHSPFFSAVGPLAAALTELAAR